MDEEFSLDVDVIEEHYKNMILSTEEYSESVTIVEDGETTLSVKEDSLSANSEACSMEALVKNCISTDAEHLSQVGETFLTVDSNLKDDINSLVTYDGE